MEEHFQLRNIYSVDTYRKLRERQVQKNEDAGYIYVWKEWHTPKEIAEIIIRTLANKKPPKKVTEKKPEDNGKEPDKTETPPDKTEVKPDKGKIPDSKKLVYAELKASADKKLAEYRKKYRGIDADPGYKNAIWGMTKSQVNLLLGKYLDAETKEDVEFITKDKGPIEKIEIHFYHDIFWKVVVNFRIIADSPQQTMEIINVLKERYGLTDEEKKEEEDALKAEEGGEGVDDAENADGAPPAEDAPAEPPAEGEGGEGGEGGEEPAPPPIPKEQEFHWKGKITLGTISIRYNDSRTGYEKLVLTRECPDIIDEVTSKIKSAREKKEAEKRRKELEDYKKEKIEF